MLKSIKRGNIRKYEEKNYYFNHFESIINSINYYSDDYYI